MSDTHSRTRTKSREVIAEPLATGSPSRNITRKEKAVVKKQGGGGKGKWHGSALAVEEAIGGIDERDPNYDSGEEEVPAGEVGYGDTEARRELEPGVSLAEFKRRVIAALNEFWSSEDTAEVARCVEELASPVFHYELVKRAVTMAMGQHDRERELVSRLLSDLYPTTLGYDQIGRGFERLFEAVDDLELDIPRARPMLSAFVARAVVDEILPPVFLADPVIKRVGGDIVEQAQRLLSINHAIPRIERVWGPGDGRPVEELKLAMDQLAGEYLCSADGDEAVRCVLELNVPHFHHELVKRCVTTCLDADEAACGRMSVLLGRLYDEAVVNRSQMEAGFSRLYHALDDLKLDTPGAEGVLNGFKQRAIDAGCLPEGWAAPPKPSAELPPPPPATA